MMHPNKGTQATRPTMGAKGLGFNKGSTLQTPKIPKAESGGSDKFGLTGRAKWEKRADETQQDGKATSFNQEPKPNKGTREFNGGDNEWLSSFTPYLKDGSSTETYTGLVIHGFSKNKSASTGEDELALIEEEADSVLKSLHLEGELDTDFDQWRILETITKFGILINLKHPEQTLPFGFQQGRPRREFGAKGSEYGITMITELQKRLIKSEFTMIGVISGIEGVAGEINLRAQNFQDELRHSTGTESFIFASTLMIRLGDYPQRTGVRKDTKAAGKWELIRVFHGVTSRRRASQLEGYLGLSGAFIETPILRHIGPFTYQVWREPKEIQEAARNPDNSSSIAETAFTPGDYYLVTGITPGPSEELFRDLSRQPRLEGLITVVYPHVENETHGFMIGVRTRSQRLQYGDIPENWIQKGQPLQFIRKERTSGQEYLRRQLDNINQYKEATRPGWSPVQGKKYRGDRNDGSTGPSSRTSISTVTPTSNAGNPHHLHSSLLELEKKIYAEFNKLRQEADSRQMVQDSKIIRMDATMRKMTETQEQMLEALMGTNSRVLALQDKLKRLNLPALESSEESGTGVWDREQQASPNLAGTKRRLLDSNSEQTPIATTNAVLDSSSIYESRNTNEGEPQLATMETMEDEQHHEELEVYLEAEGGAVQLSDIALSELTHNLPQEGSIGSQSLGREPNKTSTKTRQAGLHPGVQLGPSPSFTKLTDPPVTLGSLGQKGLILTETVQKGTELAHSGDGVIKSATEWEAAVREKKDTYGIQLTGKRVLDCYNHRYGPIMVNSNYKLINDKGLPKQINCKFVVTKNDEIKLIATKHIMATTEHPVELHASYGNSWYFRKEHRCPVKAAPSAVAIEVIDLETEESNITENLELLTPATDKESIMKLVPADSLPRSLSQPEAMDEDNDEPEYQSTGRSSEIEILVGGIRTWGNGVGIELVVTLKRIQELQMISDLEVMIQAISASPIKIVASTDFKMLEPAIHTVGGGWCGLHSLWWIRATRVNEQALICPSAGLFKKIEIIKVLTDDLKERYDSIIKFAMSIKKSESYITRLHETLLAYIAAGLRGQDVNSRYWPDMHMLYIMSEGEKFLCWWEDTATSTLWMEGGDHQTHITTLHHVEEMEEAYHQLQLRLVGHHYQPIIPVDLKAVPFKPMIQELARQIYSTINSTNAKDVSK